MRIQTRMVTVTDDRRPAVIGVDPSMTAAGIAIIARGSGDTSRPVLIRDVGEQGHRSDPWTRRARRIRAQTRRVIDVIDDHGIELNLDYRLAVIEGPAYANRLPSQWDRAGVFWGIVAALDARNIPIAVIVPTVRAMFATSHGHADKKLVLTETRALWAGCPDVVEAITNDNRADAVAMATMAAMHLDWSLPFTPRRRHIENVAKCTWPETTVRA
jgi:Holliday junction resolvasome RuvABC endonuclease subunit